MSSFSRRTVLVFPLAIAACGFEPVYAPGGSADHLRGKVLVQDPQLPDDYLLVQNLEQHLGRPVAAIYDLKVTITLGTQGQAVTASGATTRYSLVGIADYVLLRIGTDEVVTKGSVENFAGYSATGSTVETLAAERDAHKRLMAVLAKQITNQLYAAPELVI